VQVKDKSSAVLLSEIQELVCRSYARLSTMGYDHDVVVHEEYFVKPRDSSVHTQNVEIRNRWTKMAIKSYGTNRRLHSYCAEYAYRLDAHVDSARMPLCIHS